MKKVRTGAGSLSRKLTAILITAGMLLSGLSYAADNSIYIDQSGDNTSVSVTQDGAGNIVRGIQVQGGGTSNTTPSKIYGDSNTVIIEQIGSGSRLDFGINTSIAASPQANGNKFSYKVTGNNAIAIINSNNDGQGTSASNIVEVEQTGNNAYANINVLGTNNKINAVTDGGANNSFTSVINGESNRQVVSITGGGGNQANISQTGNAGTVELTSVGATNHFTINQSGGSTNGHSTAIENTGSSNTYSITQAGTSADSIVNLKSVGSSNTFTINSNTR
jgi:hypothetical protein